MILSRKKEVLLAQMKILNAFYKRPKRASLEGILQNADKKNFPCLRLGRHFLKHKKGGRGNSPRNKLLKGANRGSYIRRPFLYQKLLQGTFFLLQKAAKFLMPSERGSFGSFAGKDVRRKSFGRASILGECFFFGLLQCASR